MTRSGQGGGQPPRAGAAEDSGGRAPQPGARGRRNKAAWRLVALGLAGHMLRSRRFYERVAVAAIVLEALRGIGQDNRASTMARLAAWEKRETQRLERKADRQARTVKGAGRMARSGRPKGLAGMMPTRTEGGEHGS
jgi:hypothetical protein